MANERTHHRRGNPMLHVRCDTEYWSKLLDIKQSICPSAPERVTDSEAARYAIDMTHAAIRGAIRSNGK